MEPAINKPRAAYTSDVSDARDLAGSLRKLRKDLATNLKYMEGFGR